MTSRCAINEDISIRCGCKKRSCGPCAAVCDICDVASHQPDTLEETIVGRAVPRWTCADHDMGEMKARVAPLLTHVRPTLTAQKEAASENKRKLEAARPMEGEHLHT